jgi:hypothetical protein
MCRHRYLIACLSAVFTNAVIAADAPSSSSKSPATQSPRATPTKAERVANLEKYFADIYSKPLREKNRLSQLIGVVSLARLGGEPITKKLLAATLELDVLAGQLAWEAVHARQASLSPADREKWLAAGMDIARRGGFPGATIAPLLSACSEKPAAAFKPLPELLVRVAVENDPANKDGKPAINAARDAIATWRDPKLVQLLLARLQKKPELLPRIVAMLAGLPDPPEATEDAAKFRGVWGRYLRVNKLAPPTTRPSYAGVSKLFPVPEMIVDPGDKKWRKDLELPRLQIDAVDLAICVDATASMAASNEYVTAYIETVMRLMRLMSDQVRGGAVYYRHEIDESIMLPCCKEALEQKDGFRTRTIPFVNDPKVLVKQMLAQKLTGKTGHGKDRIYAGAFAGGIETAMKMNWSPSGKRIIVSTGDDNATLGSEQKLLDLAEQAKKEGTLLLFVVRDTTAAKSIAPASKAATGLDPIIYKDDVEKLKATSQPATSMTAIEQFKGTAFETMTTRVLELSLPEGYRDRVKPLMAAVLPILKGQDAAAKATASIGK